MMLSLFLILHCVLGVSVGQSVTIDPEGDVIVVEGRPFSITCTDGENRGSSLFLRENRVILTGDNIPPNEVDGTMRIYRITVSRTQDGNVYDCESVLTAMRSPVVTFNVTSLCVGPPVKPIEPIPSASIIGGIIGGAYVVSALVVIITIVVIIIIKDKQKKKSSDGVKLTRQPGEEMATLPEDTTYASPGKETAATEGADGVYPYAATTTVVGAKMDPRRRAGKEASDETKYAQLNKRKRYKQPPTTADVPHKQEPAGELYVMPEKKPLTVGHAQGPQGDMYAVPAKPSKGTNGAEGPQ